MTLRLLTLALGAALGTGCAEVTHPLSRARDSAGIRIVDNDGPAGPTLVLDSAPAFDIGPAGGPGAEFISSPVSAVRLRDGRIIAAGWAMSDVRVFDATGRWVRTVGRQGAGPGEFEALGFVYRGPDDSVITFEPGTQRLQHWTPAIEFRRLATLISASDRSTPWVWGAFPDGSLLLSTAPRRSGNHSLNRSEPDHPPPGSGFGRSLGFFVQFHGAALASAPVQPQLEVWQSVVQPGARLPSARQPNRICSRRPVRDRTSRAGWPASDHRPAGDRLEVGVGS